MSIHVVSYQRSNRKVQKGKKKYSESRKPSYWVRNASNEVVEKWKTNQQIPNQTLFIDTLDIIQFSDSSTTLMETFLTKILQIFQTLPNNAMICLCLVTVLHKTCLLCLSDFISSNKSLLNRRSSAGSRGFTCYFSYAHAHFHFWNARQKYRQMIFFPPAWLKVDFFFLNFR